RANHGIQAAFAVLGNLSSGHQDTVGLGRSATDSTTELMELRQPEAFGVFNDHDRGVGHIDTDFDHRSSNQNIDLAFLEQPHGLILQIGVEAAVQEAYPQIGEHSLVQLLIHFDRGFELLLLAFLNDGIDDVYLMSGGDLFAHKFPDFSRAFVRNATGDDRHAAGRHLVDDAHIEVAIERKSESPRDWSCGHD